MNREVHVRFWEGVGVKFSRATQLHVARTMTSERCVSPRDHKRCQAGPWLLGDPPPVLSRSEGAYRRGENASTGRHDPPLLSYGGLSRRQRVPTPYPVQVMIKNRWELKSFWS